jgi:hypothetical protein
LARASVKQGFFFERGKLMFNHFHSRIFVLLLAVSLALAGSGCLGFLAPKPTPTPLISSSFDPARGMNEVKCPFTGPQGVDFTCYQLEVPEDYAQIEGDKIELFATVIHSPNPVPARDALVLLPQNAGLSLTDQVAYIGGQLGELLEDRDLVYYEYRGLEQSGVDLNCPEFYQAYLQTWLDALNPEEEAALYIPATGNLQGADVKCRNRCQPVYG